LATQVAEWAGHSVYVVLKVYAKCIAGRTRPLAGEPDAEAADQG
jgi:hypothetical protein